MKKFISIMLLLAVAASTLAQDFPMGVSDGTQVAPSRDNEYVCLDGSVFSQVEASMDQAYFCQVGYPFTQVADDYIASAPFSNMRFWGGDAFGCTLAATESFDITIYDGNPSSGGSVVHSFTLDGVVTMIPVIAFGTQFYQIDIDFGIIINQLSGWIAISRNSATCDDGFGWSADELTYGGGNAMSYDGTWLANDGQVFFCLYGNDPIPMPLSDWAIYLGIILIIAFTAYRLRGILS